MKIAGIIAEYNPFHTGHAYQIARTRAALGEECAVLAVMSGNWVQGGRPAVLDKWTRTRLALLGGADLVLELPTVWAASSAESFARGAASLLEASGAADVLSFGSECGEAGRLQQLAACLDSPSYETEIRRLADGGRPFAAARQQAVQNLLGEELSSLLSAPNNNLGVEYIRALNALKSAISPMTVRREGARHDALLAEDASPLPVGAASGRPQVEAKPDRRPEAAPGPKFLSATQLRLFLEREDWAALEPYLPEGGVEALRAGWNGFPSLTRVERGILAKLRAWTAEDWAKLPDSGAAEGLAQRLERSGRFSRSLGEFFALAKSKRWTHARLRRLLVWAYLDLTLADRPDVPPYLRVLGFTQRGQLVLREMKGRAALPILTKPAHAHHLDETGRRLFELEARCTDLYDLCLEHIPIPGQEWTTSPVRL